MPIMLECRVCGKVFYRSPSQADTAKFCSYACNSVERAAARKWETVVCSVCGKTARRSPARPGKFCSRKCFGAAKRGVSFCRPAVPIEERFPLMVDQNGPLAPDGSRCHTYLGGANSYGYGRAFDQRAVGAHIVAWTLANGRRPRRGFVVMHFVCDNPLCVNPAHLREDTYQANTDDMMKKGRNVPPVGARNGMAKLTEARAVELLAALAAGESVADVAERFGVSKVTVYVIRQGKRWAHLPRP